VFFTGLLSKLEKKGEVAAIMSHEIAHALMRHHAERSALNGFINTALFAVELLLDISIPRWIVGLGLLPYSRAQEIEADKVGLLIMSRACFDPQYAVLAHRRLMKLVGEKNGVTKYFSTHPNFNERIETLKALQSAAERERVSFCPKYRSSVELSVDVKPDIVNWYDGLKI